MLNLNLHPKTKIDLLSHDPQPLSVPNTLGNTWSMDFISERLHNNIRFRAFNVIDNYNCKVLDIDIATSIPSLRVFHYLAQLAEWNRYPKQIRLDNGSEFIFGTFTDWASAHNIYIDYIEPGCPY